MLEARTKRKATAQTSDYQSIDNQASDEQVIHMDSDDENSVYGGTLLSSYINISNTILGSGMLAMPSAIASTGLGLGILTVLFFGSCSLFGLYLLTKVAEQSHRKSSFFSCSLLTYPSLGVYFDFAIAIKCFGVSVSYLVICGDLFPQVVKGFFPGTEDTSVWVSKPVWITLCIFLIAPTCFLKNLNSLRYTSAFALSAVLYLLFVVVVFYLSPPAGMPFPHPTFGEITWFRLDIYSFTHLPIFVFAFTCHQNVFRINQIFAVYNELADNSSKRIQTVIKSSVGTAIGVYQTIGILGYLTFGDHVKSNIIKMYPSSGFVTGGQLSISMLVLLSYPLQCHPARASFTKVFAGDHQLTPTSYRALTLVLIAASWIVSVSVKDLSTVLSVVGATGSTTICYILPGLFYYKLAKNMGKSDYLSTMAAGLVVLGCTVMVISLAALAFGGVAH